MPPASTATARADAVAASVDALRPELLRGADERDRVTINRLLDEAKHYLAAACAAAGVHPTARPDVEVVRPSQVGA